jgi:Uma2 family endonuclease
LMAGAAVSTLAKAYLSPEQYLEIERKAERKSEYYNGEMFAMAGARPDHVRIVGNVFANLHNQLRRRPCEPFSGDMRVRVGDTGLYTYPDIVIACDPRFIEPEHDTLLNPVVIIEVLSPSTEAYDRGRKFALYRTVESLREYVVIASDSVQVERFAKQDDQCWLLTAVDRLEGTVELNSIRCNINLTDTYEGVDFLKEAA